ncbi:uncharacterized protein K02A2.6-like isoform X1 [Amphibalanus amphitrite]|uniref:uncharacterized protein K02A2.6-like isoform X2 n=1 Tax=Amphibalanus amphitrite TaxID=1232801 RepID=UPI001C918CD5|nr:uncharacterized protein K02A2.6-like isoform X2 [Amphibalanus amphitrite]XP_043198410.1 uncharacterized protein K02A2.6-like isoform X2 [Amphibalanus amphitrite]XP_043238642.1 uncharacterized protein K02A2.6-like isoform X1 [Amphibalanus amphitrite]
MERWQAKAMEAVQREASCFSGEVAAAANRVASGPQRTIRSAQPGHRDAPTSADSAKYGRSCWRCGNRHGGKCRFESAKCYACGRQGHISRCCRQQASSVHHQGVSGEQPDDDSGAVEPVLLENLSTPSQPVYVVNRAQVSSPPIWCPVQICSTQVNMELDTGAGVTLIDEHTYRRFQKRPKLNSSPVKLRSFTGNTIPVLGEFSTDVTYNGRLYRQLPIVVVHGSAPCLLGRNWLEKMQICWSDVHALRTSHLQRLKSKYGSVFREGLGTLKGVEVRLDIDRSVVPKFFKARSLPFAYKQKVEDQLDADIASGVLVPVRNSRWAAPIVPVVRPDGRIRVCANFKLTANRAVKLDKYPLPKTEEMFAKLGSKKVWSKIDLAQAYNQVKIHKDSRDILTINTSRGLLQYTRMPFGVNCAVGVFQREIERVLSGIPDVVVYLDDVLVGSQSEEEHWKVLGSIFSRLEAAGLRVRETKCAFFQDSVEYLGHHMSRDGIRPTSDKVKAIVDAPRPANVTELKSFLGLVTYYSRFIAQRAEVLSPLYDLLRAGASWTWGPSQEKSFNSVKDALASHTLLVHFDPEKQLILTTDASCRGVAAVLAHLDDNGVEAPIAFASRRLSVAEQKYSQIEREGLAVIMGVTKFHQYLCGVTRPFFLVTDHKPLFKLFGQHEALPEMASGRIRRWALKLSGYNYRIQFKRTHEIANADALSRLPSPYIEGAQPEELVLHADEDWSGAEVGEAGPQPEELELLTAQSWLDAKQVAKLTSMDPVLSNVVRLVQFGGWPTQIPESLKCFAPKKDELSLTAGVLLWGHRVVIPDAARRAVLMELHVGHPGIGKMKALARSVVWWPGIDQDVEAVVGGCTACQESRDSPPHRELHPWPWPTKPWSRIHADFAEPEKGKYVLVVVDSHSKWIEAEVMYSTASAPTINKFRAMFARWGLPDMICTDNGTTFTSTEFQQFLRENGIVHRTIEPRHSQGNGLAERAVKEVKLALQRESDSGGPWDLRLTRWLMRQRTTPHSTTMVTPAELMMGRRLRTRLDLLFPDIGKTVLQQQNRQRAYFDRTAQCRQMLVGDAVFARNYAVGLQWLPGVIVGTDGPVSYVVRLFDGRLWRRHGDQLRRRQSAEPISPPEAASREVRRPSSDAAVQPGRPGGASQGTAPPAPLSSAVQPSQSRPGALTQQPPPPNVRSSPTRPGVPAQSSHRPSPVSAPSSLEPGGPPQPSADVWPSSAPGTCPAPSSPDGTGPHPEVATSVERTLRRSTRTRRAPELYQAGSGM